MGRVLLLWALAAAEELIPLIPGIEEHLQPPRHEAFAHLEFLDLLRVEGSAQPGSGRSALPKVEPQPRHVGFAMASILRSLVEPLTAWRQAVSPLKLLAETPYWSWPSGEMSNFEAPKKLAAGSFGVVFLAKDKTTNQQVAVKLLKSNTMTMSGVGIWATSKLYHSDKTGNLKSLVDGSRQECINIQKIQEGGSKDPEGSSHVLKCLYDGITPLLQTPASETPLYIVLEFAGRDDLDVWWTKFQNRTKLHKDYVQMFKNMAKHMFMGLRFLGESPTDSQWIHHDLKSMNMVVNDDDQLVIVDLGTAISSAEKNSTQACTAFSRPPEVCPFLWLVPMVGFKQPIWSYDVFSAAATLMGMAGDAVNNKEVAGIGTLPFYTYYMQEIIQHSMARVELLTRAIHCARKEASDPKSKSSKAKAFAQAFYTCAGEIASEVFQEVNTQRLKAIQGSSGEPRKAELASLLNCRQVPVGADVVERMQGLGEPKPSVFFWTLLDDWMSTGFDELLLKAMSSDPNERPKPSELLEAQWFKRQEIIGEGKAVEFTCPELPMDDSTKIRIMLVLVVLAEILCICLCCCGGIFTVRAGTLLWKWMLPIAGCLVISVPVSEFYIVSWNYLWLILMVPVGLAMIILGVSATPQMQAKVKLDKRWYLGAVALAVLLMVLICLDHTLSLSSLPYASQQLNQARKDGIPEKVPEASSSIQSIDAFLGNFLGYNFFCLGAVLFALGSLIMDSSFARRTSTDSGEQARDVELPSRAAM